MERVYSEFHSILDREFLDRGYELKEQLETQGLSPEEFEKQLDMQLGYVRARIPAEFWDKSTRPRISSRMMWKELQAYFENAGTIRKRGLGLTLLGSGMGFRTQALYVVCRELVDRGFSCFTTAYDELVYFLKEAWSDPILKKELDVRFGSDFFAFIEVPGGDDITSSIRQDLLARFHLRQARGLPTIFSVNIGAQSLSDVPSESFVGRLLAPFVRVNKPVVVEELGDVDEMYLDRWRLLDGET